MAVEQDAGQLHLDDVGHRFDGAENWLFRQVQLQVPAGARFALTGPSGSGKSTLLAIIAGAIRPAEGTVWGASDGRLQWVFQNPFGVAKRAAFDHVTLPRLARGESADTAERHAAGLLEQVGLGHVTDGRPFSALSGGEGQRLMLARAFAAEPDLLLVDEPTAQLDRASALAVRDAIRSLESRRTIVIVATHDLETAAACDEIVDLGDYAPRPQTRAEEASGSTDVRERDAV